MADSPTPETPKQPTVDWATIGKVLGGLVVGIVICAFVIFVIGFLFPWFVR